MFFFLQDLRSFVVNVPLKFRDSPCGSLVSERKRRGAILVPRPGSNFSLLGQSVLAVKRLLETDRGTLNPWDLLLLVRAILCVEASDLLSRMFNSLTLVS